jgi:PTS hybrid protein
LVSLVLISHSRSLGEGLRDMVSQVAGPDVQVAVAAGTEDGRLGTSAPLIVDAIRTALAGGPAGAADGVLVLLDLGSAALSLEIALEDLTQLERSRVRVSEAPLVEGAVLAAVQASLGATLEATYQAASEAATMSKLPRA